MKKKIPQYYIDDVVEKLKEETGLSFNISEYKKITVPKFVRFGGDFFFVKFANEEKGITVTGILVNGYFMFSSIQDYWYAGVVSEYWSHDRKDVKEVADAIKTNILNRKISAE